MCGIAGILGRRAPLPAAREPIERMVRALRHRGPDAAGIYRDPFCHLGHTRLSIVDLAGGDQPLSTADGRYWTAFNGELFNHLELRRELEARGRRFATRSDTEVLVSAFAEWGEDAFARFNGQWAAAIWDRVERQLVLSRDPVGIRPLYLAEHDGRLFFASEVKALFAGAPDLPRAFDPRGLDELFTFWAPVAPRTLFAGIEELEPGTTVRFDGERSRRSVHYRADYSRSEPAPGLDEAAGQVRRALQAATRLQVSRSDVPVGAYLSGGLDSAITASLARELGPLTTFSLRFEDREFDEAPFQRRMVEQLGTDHHELVVRQADLLEALPDAVLHAERPFLRTAPVPLLLLSRKVRAQGFKVVLTGEGADEMFAGYDLFREAKVRRFWSRAPESRLRPRLLERLYPYLARSPVTQQAIAARFFGRDLDRAGHFGFSHGPRWRSTAALKRLFSAPVQAELQGADAELELASRLPADFAQWDPLSRAQYLEVKTLLSGYLLCSQGDRMLMASSVEGRFPFLDVEVMALANRLPPSYKLRGLDEKHVLKRAFPELPEEIRRRPKQPYRAPDLGALFAKGGSGFAREALSPRSVAEVGVFDPAQVEALVNKCARLEGRPLSNTDAMALVGVLSTQLLHRSLIARSPELASPLVLSRDLDRTSDGQVEVGR